MSSFTSCSGYSFKNSILEYTGYNILQNTEPFRDILRSLIIYRLANSNTETPVAIPKEKLKIKQATNSPAP